ncbi:MAG: flagella basal body P-ring formation protein FlgA [Gammaproteobacteria bacterium CG22_combo_CG10-13_8_21_14_all_40_8]|nr:MAG: flagella basal body P-ring formation protein FlgA [Gammaproteobacteria bacterium CG22_combo_CG10-13_8_21_14_all_40_8]
MLSIGHLKRFAHTKLGIIFSLSYLLMPFTTNSAAPAQSLTEIQEVAEHFLSDQMKLRGIMDEDINIQVTSPDNRLLLEHCLNPLEAFTPTNATLLGNTTVGVKCTSPQWQIYLPAKVAQLTDVWVYQQNYQKGDLLNSRDISLEKRALSTRLHPINLPIDKLNQLRLTKTIRRGQVIQENDLCMVCKGDKVDLVVKAETLTVRMNGISLNDGLQGQSITVRNDKSKKLVTGVAFSAGEIRIIL